MLVKIIIIMVYQVLFNLRKDSVKINNYKIENNLNLNISHASFMEKIEEEHDNIATITINDAYIYDKPLYEIHNIKNNINKNITILNGNINPSNNNDILVLAAHSGTGSIAYFKNLYKLKIGNKIIIKYKNIDYLYIVTNIYEEKKNGSIIIEKKNNINLILTTCSYNDNMQLIVECTLKRD